MAGYLFTNQSPNALASPNFNNPTTLIGTVNGTNKVFTWPSDPGPSWVIILGGVFQIPGVNFTYNKASLQITFVEAPVVAPIGFW
jgi:hypothetical protein